MSSVVIGIDIAYEAVKICGLVKNGKNYRLVGLNYASIPKDSWTADELKNREEISRVLRDSLKSAKPSPLNGNQAMIALPETAVYSGTFSMPLLSKEELEQALPFEIAERMAINPEEYHIDYETLTSSCQPLAETVNALGTNSPAAGHASAPDASKKTDEASKTGADAVHMAVFAVAVKRSLVDSILELCKDAKLVVAGIDIKAGAIVNALIKNDDKKMRLIIDLGASTTGVTVAEGKSLHLISSVPLGTRALGQDLATQLEAFKKIAGPVLDELVHVTKFFENRICPGRRIEEIILTGGGSNVQGITEFFQTQTGLKTVIGNPLAQIDVHRYPIKTDMAHKFADSIGLAMRTTHA